MDIWIVIFDSLSTLGFLLAFIFTFQIPKDKLGPTSKLFLSLGIGLYVLVGISNILEHLNIATYFDSYEDYLEILFIPFFMFFLFSLYMEQQLRERERIQEELFEEKERAQVTLDSIGDAVITTDHYGHVKYLNPVAEELTGWVAKDAYNQPLGRVFQIIN
jgi:PAS domain-containing protein